MAETKDTLPAEEELSEAGKIMRMITEGKNPRGIPNAKFIVSSNYNYILTFSSLLHVNI